MRVTRLREFNVVNEPNNDNQFGRQPLPTQDLTLFLGA